MAVAIGALIRRRRVELGISRERLAYESGLSLSTMLRIELHNHVPRADRLAAIARVLGVTADDLLGETAA
ncbi:MAG TPA: helix-turn-helix transcriptional regulator [Acidimicrobiia bacterium]|nr:helix-turn-helix transcriptional regulator [Acidimicrobiia bacterium]